MAASKKNTMAASKSNRCYLNVAEAPNASFSPKNEFDFDENEIWSTNDDVCTTKEVVEAKKVVRRLDLARKPLTSKSVPVDIPMCGRRADNEGGNDKMPPHEYLARVRGASLSVTEGLGRTLKGRDLCRVRDAILRLTGFED